MIAATQLRGLVVGLAALAALATQAKACGLALVLAVDVSSSIDPGEYRFQIEGLAEALEDPVIAEALLVEQAALAVIQWSGDGQQEVTLPWRRMRTPEDVQGFADRVRLSTRTWLRGKTAIGDAISFSAAQFALVPDCARQVIDVSGDGMTNAGGDTSMQSSAVSRLGVGVNGLAIDRIGRSVTEFYRRNVIAGPNAFVMTATGYSDYPRAIRLKLYQEVVRPGS